MSYISHECQVFRPLRRWNLLWERVNLTLTYPDEYPTGPFSFLWSHAYQVIFQWLIWFPVFLIRLGYWKWDIWIYKWICLCLLSISVSPQLRKFVQPDAIPLRTLLTHPYSALSLPNSGICGEEPSSDQQTGLPFPLTPAWLYWTFFLWIIKIRILAH